MNKETILMIAGVVGLVLSVVCLFISGVAVGNITDIVIAVVGLASLIAGLFGLRKKVQLKVDIEVKK